MSLSKLEKISIFASKNGLFQAILTEVISLSDSASLSPVDTFSTRRCETCTMRACRVHYTHYWL